MMSTLSRHLSQQRPRSGSRARWAVPAVLVMVTTLLVLPACTAGGSPSTNTGSNGTPSTTANTASTPTAKPKPSALPPVNLAFCQHLLSLDEANQIFNPSNPAVTIDVSAPPSVGLCDYLNSQGLTPSGLVVQIRLGSYTGSTPIPQQQIEDYFKQGLNQPGVTILNVTPVSGVGDQAGAVAGSYADQGTTIYGAAFYVLYGNVVFLCGNLSLSAPSAAQQGALKQCAQLVVSRL